MSNNKLTILLFTILVPIISFEAGSSEARSSVKEKSYIAGEDQIKTIYDDYLIYCTTITSIANASNPRSVLLHIYKNNQSNYPRSMIDSKIKFLSDVMQNCWVGNFDKDNDIEIVLTTKVTGSGGYGFLYLFKFNGKNIKEINVSRPENSVMKDYGGHDKYYMNNNEIIREFPTYNEGDNHHHSTTGKVKRLRFDTYKNTWKYEGEVKKSNNY